MILENKTSAAYIFNKVKYDLLIVFLVGAITNVLTVKFNHLLPEMPLSIPALLGTAISILLSFKMNQSYDRWWEARKVWGAIVNDSRTLVVQLQSFLPDSESETIKRISYRQIAWCFALTKALRGLNPIEGIEQNLSIDDLKEIQQHNNKHLAILMQNARDLKALRQEGIIDGFAHLQL